MASGTDPESPSEAIDGYNPFGGMQRLLLQGGAMVQSARYNERGQMTRIGLHKTPTVGTASRLLRLGLDYGPAGENNGNIRTMTVAAGQATGNTNPLFRATQSYEYEAVNRLQSAAEGTAWKQTFGYDRFGNRWIEAGPSPFGIDSRGAATGLASYVGSTNRLSGVPHDWAGNASPAGLTLTYDVENRAVKMVTNGAESLYEYDGEGRRVMKVSGGVTTTYVYDAAGQLAAEYATGGSEVGETGRRYLFADHLGSTRLRTAQDGTVVEWWDYAPFGEEVPGTAGGRSGVSGVPYGGTYAKVRFGGKERDVEGATSSSLGLDYFEARYLGVGLGRFTSPDALITRGEWLSDPQRLNLSSYVRNNPLRYADPSGEDLTFVYSTDGLDEDNLTFFNKNRKAIFAAIEKKFKAAGVGKVHFIDKKNSRPGEKTQMAEKPQANFRAQGFVHGLVDVRLLNDASVLLGNRATKAFGFSNSGRAEIFLTNIADRGCGRICATANVVAHEVGHVLGLDDRGHDISGLGFTQGISAIELLREAAWRPRDVMYSGIEPPWPSDSWGPYIKPLDFNLQVERNARILRELNGIPRVY